MTSVNNIGNAMTPLYLWMAHLQFHCRIAVDESCSYHVDNETSWDSDGTNRNNRPNYETVSGNRRQLRLDWKWRHQKLPPLHQLQTTLLVERRPDDKPITRFWWRVLCWADEVPPSFWDNSQGHIWRQRVVYRSDMMPAFTEEQCLVCILSGAINGRLDYYWYYKCE